MTTWVVPSAASAKVPTADLHPAKSKDEAIAACDTYPEKANHFEVYRDGPEGKDVFYSCDSQKEHPSRFNRSEKCDPKSFKVEETPASNNAYKCNKDGRLVIVRCGMVGDLFNSKPGCKPVPGYV